MLKRMIFPVFLGLVGGGILIALGVWQLQRMAWKEGVLATIRAEIVKPPVALDPTIPGIATEKYLSVKTTGVLARRSLRVLTSLPPYGPGYRVIARLETRKGPILVDLGFRPEYYKVTDFPTGPVTLVGNILWPEEVDSYTPAPNMAKNIWFARDVPKMATALGTGKIMVVARMISPAPKGILPWPVSAEGIPNNHLQYVITWFSLAVLWLGMTVYWLWRIRRRLD